jgi:uncharacterized membrane protein YgdD (TMEM256/DUF423 family)
MHGFFFVAGSISAFLAVVLGAFAAHALKSRLPADMLDTFEIGVRYHMYHSFGLLAVAWASTHWPHTRQYCRVVFSRRDRHLFG